MKFGSTRWNALISDPYWNMKKTLETTSQTAKRAQKLVSPFGELGKSRPQPNPESTAADAQKKSLHRCNRVSKLHNPHWLMVLAFK